MDEINKIDQIRERMGVTYQQAKEALDKSGGDLVQALIYLENNKKKWDDKLDEKSRQLLEYIRDTIKKGNVTKVRLKKGDKVVFEVSATVGALGVGGAMLVPPLAFIGVVATLEDLINDYRLEIVRPDGKVEEHGLDFLAKDNDDEPAN